MQCSLLWRCDASSDAYYKFNYSYLYNQLRKAVESFSAALYLRYLVISDPLRDKKTKYWIVREGKLEYYICSISRTQLETTSLV